MSKLVLNVEYVLVIVIFFNCGRVLQFRAHSFKALYGCINSKDIIFSDLYYFQIWFLCWLKKSKQKFNTIFVIQWSVQMTWTRHKIPSVIVIQQIMRVTRWIVLPFLPKALYELGFFEGIVRSGKTIPQINRMVY